MIPEYIFYEDGKYEFCYLPAKETELCKEFHKLTEYFVSRIDHREQKGIRIAYELHKATMEENYNLEKMLGKIKRKEEKKEAALDKVKEILQTIGYSMQDTTRTSYLSMLLAK